MQLLGREDFGVVLLDMNYSDGANRGEEGYHWLQQIRSNYPQVVVVMMTAFGDVDTAVSAIKQGASDFVLKPWHPEKLLATLASAIELHQSRRQVAHLQGANRELQESTADGSPILGVSPAMQNIMRVVDRSATTDANILITGENGAGKEVLAREIHRRSGRGDQLFMSIDLGTLAEELFESELFGHCKGAFTGAASDRIGRLQAADGGTLFLDEIGNLPLHMQSKLLTALEQRQVVPVGSNKAVAFDVRVISATNMPRQLLNDASHFRQDLLYRINTVEIHVPSLRERREDIPILAAHFLQTFGKKYQKPNMSLGSDALEQLLRNPWKGNVRELRHVLERAVIMAGDEVLGAGDVLVAPVGAGGEPETPTRNLEQMERNLITQTLKEQQGNISRAARELGITRASLYRRMEKFGI